MVLDGGDSRVRLVYKCCSGAVLCGVKCTERWLSLDPFPNPGLGITLAFLLTSPFESKIGFSFLHHGLHYCSKKLSTNPGLDKTTLMTANAFVKRGK